jgi:hypothetical protein
MASKQRFFIIAPESKAAREQCSLKGMAPSWDKIVTSKDLAKPCNTYALRTRTHIVLKTLELCEHSTTSE